MTRVAIAGAAALCAWAPRPCSAAGPVEVPPGSVVRWVGTGVESCSAFGRSWLPIADTCWFAVDLLHQAGPAELSRQVDGRVEELVIRVGPYPYPVQRLTVSEHMVHLSEEDLARVEAENRRIATLWQRSESPRFVLPLDPPLERAGTGRSFGARRILNDEPRSPHSGVDYAAPAGAPVHAAADGTVVLAEEHFFAGNSVFIDHGGGLISMYFHLHEVAVSTDQEVRRGEVIGTVGASGRATGPHLHFGLRWHGARVDPAMVLGPVEAIPSVQR